MYYKENIETAIKTLEALVKKMADSREEIAENRIEKASEIDVAGKIIEYLEEKIQNKDKSKPMDI